MAQFRTTSDILDLALTNGGEVTNGNSPYEAQVLNYLNRVHFAIVAGGTIPLGGDSSITIDEVWPWARSAKPLILELQPKYETGTIAVTQGSEAGAFSSAPTASLQGWYIQIQGRDEWLRIGSHTGGATAFEFDGSYPDETSASATFRAVKLDYDLIPDFIVIDSTNNKLQFQEAAGTTLTATLTSGTYTPAQLATEVQTQLLATGGAPVYTVNYNSVSRKFTIASDRAASSVFVLVCTGSQALFSAHRALGFDDSDTANAASIESTYLLGGIARLVEPMKIHKGSSKEGSIYGIDSESFQRNYPFALVEEGIPDRFSVVRELPDGTLTVRFNRYPTDKTRVEVEKVDVPRDLKDSAASIPLLPRKHVDVLEDAATFFLMLNKNDNRAPTYAQLVNGKLKAMVAQHRGSLQRSGKNFGQIIPRADLITSPRRKLRFGYDE